MWNDSKLQSVTTDISKLSTYFGIRPFYRYIFTAFPQNLWVAQPPSGFIGFLNPCGCTQLRLFSMSQNFPTFVLRALLSCLSFECPVSFSFPVCSFHFPAWSFSFPFVPVSFSMFSSLLLFFPFASLLSILPWLSLLSFVSFLCFFTILYVLSFCFFTILFVLSLCFFTIVLPSLFLHVSTLVLTFPGVSFCLVVLKMLGELLCWHSKFQSKAQFSSPWPIKMAKAQKQKSHQTIDWEDGELADWFSKHSEQESTSFPRFLDGSFRQSRFQSSLQYYSFTLIQFHSAIPSSVKNG